MVTEESRLLETILLDILDERLVPMTIYNQRADVLAEPRPVRDDEGPAVRHPLDHIVKLRFE